MKRNTRQKCSLAAGLAALLAMAVLLFSSLNSYGHQVPVIIGPYKQTALIFCGLMILLAVGFYFRPLRKNTVWGSVLLLFGAAWFSLRMLTAWQSPDSALGVEMDRWMPVPLAALGMGLALWLEAFLPEHRTFQIPSARAEVCLALLLMFLLLQPVLSGHFCWDDAFFSVEAQSLRISGESVFARVWQEIVDYVRIGRVNPFATFHLLVFYFIPDPRAYKLLMLVLTLLDGFLFYRFVQLWGKGHRGALMALLAVPLCFQLRLYHDPLNSYYGLMQVMFCELMLALIWFIRWLREGKTRHLVLSLTVFAMGLMSYEMFFPLTALFLIPAWDEEKEVRGTIRRVLPYVLLAAGLFALSMLLRRNITEETAYNGTTFSLEPLTILRTWLYQVTAAFPLSYRLAGEDAGLFGTRIPWQELFGSSLTAFLSNIRWGDVLACVLLALLILPGRKEKPSGKQALFAFLLWLLPGLVISLSWKYQQELRPGLAYIPVFFSCFGAAWLLSLLTGWLESKFPSRMTRFLLCGAGCAVLLLTLQDNRHISAMLDDIFRYPREISENALQAGILGDSVNEKTLVLSANGYSLWEHGWEYAPYQTRFYSLNARQPLQAMSVRDYVTRNAKKAGKWLTPGNVLLYAADGNSTEGFARAGRLRGTGISPKKSKLTNPMVSDVYVFVSGENEKGSVLMYETRDEEFKQVRFEDMWLIRKTDNGTLYKLEESSPVLFETIGLFYQ